MPSGDIASDAYSSDAALARSGTPDVPLAAFSLPDAQGSFRALYDTTVAAVQHYLARRCADRAACRDLCEDVYLVAWRRRDHIPDPALPWLYGIARRCLANHRRGERRRAGLLTRLAGIRQAPSSEPELIDDRLVEALGQLRETDRELLLLIAWEDLSVNDAARIVGLRPGTARVRLHRARARIAAQLDERADEDAAPDM